MGLKATLVGTEEVTLDSFVLVCVGVVSKIAGMVNPLIACGLCWFLCSSKHIGQLYQWGTEAGWWIIPV